MITNLNAKPEKTFVGYIFNEQQNAVPNDELLYRYLLKNTALKAYDDGLDDEQHKVLKHFGVNYWEPGMEEVTFDGKTYKVVKNEK